jgi:Ca2+-transporting ATPase
LNQQLDQLAKLISKVGTGLSIAAFVLFLGHDILTDELWHTHDYMRMVEVVLKYFMMAVTLIVMAVPEGLPMAITLALALNMRRMLKSNNLVRKLHACETMGAVTVICTDKTGTLTENRMKVAAVSECDGSDHQLLEWNMAVNSTAEYDGEKGIGNPTEVALLQSLSQTDYKALRLEAVVEDQLPFSTEKKYMQTTAVIRGQRYTFVKGAPEIVMGMCEDMDGNEWNRMNEQLLVYQRQAMRTLAFACNGQFQGIVGISDPVRQNVPEAVKQCQQAGIEVKIVTGDTAATAMEIARQVGILDVNDNLDLNDDLNLNDNLNLNDDNNQNLYCISGPEFAALTDEEARECVKTLKVMSRARPSDKQRLVEMLQQNGAIVAVTGDGTNDAPALNHAHVGLSLGSGTSVAKNASDMTLLDDSFNSIVNAVMWGRSLYKNIQRFLFFQLGVNVTALLLVIGGSFIGTEMPLTVTQILWVNLIMDTFAAMALASLPPSREVLKDKPRAREDFIISRSMWRSILTVGVLFFIVLFGMFWYYLNDDKEFGVQQQELTVFFTTFVMLQWWNLFNAKSLGSVHSAFRRLYADRGMLMVLVLILAGQWLIVTFGGKMFRTAPLSLNQWLVIIAATSVVLWMGEVVRWGMRRWGSQ